MTHTPPHSHLARVTASFLLCLACVFTSPLTLQAAASLPARTFDVPSDLAERSLRKFSDQAGIQVIFSPSVADGVRTNAVKGVLTSREAAKRLLAGTNLTLVADEKTGVYSVVRAEARGKTNRGRRRKRQATARSRIATRNRQNEDESTQRSPMGRPLSSTWDPSGAHVQQDNPGTQHNGRCRRTGLA